MAEGKESASALYLAADGLIASAKEYTFSIVVVCLSVCLSVSNFAQKLPNGFA